MADVQVGGRRWTRRLIWINTVLAVLVVAGGLVWWLNRGNGGVDQLAARDPHGAAACRALRNWASGNYDHPAGRPLTRDATQMAETVEVRQASTADIRAAAHGSTTNLDELRAACIAAGVPIGALPAS